MERDKNEKEMIVSRTYLVINKYLLLSYTIWLQAIVSLINFEQFAKIASFFLKYISNLMVFLDNFYHYIFRSKAKYN